jgi:hypothetical protein
MKDKKLPPYLISVEDQQEREGKRRVTEQVRRSQIKVGDMVKCYRIEGVTRLKVSGIYNTAVENVKLYELVDSYKNHYYSTIDFIDPV